MPTDIFNNLDDPEQMRYVKSAIESVDDNITLANLLKMLSQKIHDNAIDPENAETIHVMIISRQEELAEMLKRRRSNKNGRQMTLTRNTAIDNRVGTAAVVFLVTNIAVTTAMYTLLVISHFLNN